MPKICFKFFSSLTTLNGEEARGFVGISQVECAVTVHARKVLPPGGVIRNYRLAPVRYRTAAPAAKAFTVLLDRLPLPCMR